MKGKINTKIGISLIVLVITIIIIIILSTSIIVSIAQNNPIGQANKAKFESDRDNMQALLTMAISKITTDKQGSVKVDSGEIIEGKIQYVVENAVDKNNGAGIIIFAKGKDTENTAYVGKELPVYKSGETHWYVDEKGKLSLKVGDKEIGNIPPPPSISKTEKFVGCYADINDDGKIDGIIFADLAVGGSGIWQGTLHRPDDERQKYIVPKIEDTSKIKDYYIKGKIIDERWDRKKSKDVIVPQKGTTGEDRFYIMALEDIKLDNEKTFSWYYNAYSKLDYKYTSLEFGSGRENTKKMIKLFNENRWGNPNIYGSIDVWQSIQEAAVVTSENTNWFIPSKEEWKAFGGELVITRTSYKDGIEYDGWYESHYLRDWYWTSSISNTVQVWYANLQMESMSEQYTNYNAYRIRLATTF